ncbi:YHYH protein-domain-containing protein [Chytridium lagenaria]|nr:YHYH protein-domain-containing protein [Chytridium lagenaria]
MVGRIRFIGSVLLALGTHVCSQQTTSTNAQCGTTSSGPMVYVSVAGGTAAIQASGCPNYDWTSQKTPNKAQVQCLNFTVPRSPTINNTPFYIGVYTDKTQKTTNTAIPMGQLGITVNGVAIYGNADATKSDAYVTEGKTMDTCGGHPDMSGTYHYHDEPTSGCVIKETKTSHSPLFGIMLDGIPIYGPYGDTGAVPTDLDECNGHVDKTNSFYHYHLAANETYPYTVNCLKGCVSKTISKSNAANSAPACSAATTQYDYSTLYTTVFPASNSSVSYSCNVSTGASLRVTSFSTVSSGAISNGTTSSGSTSSSSGSAVAVAVAVPPTVSSTSSSSGPILISSTDPMVGGTSSGSAPAIIAVSPPNAVSISVDGSGNIGATVGDFTVGATTSSAIAGTVGSVINAVSGAVSGVIGAIAGGTTGTGTVPLANGAVAISAPAGAGGTVVAAAGAVQSPITVPKSTALKTAIGIVHSAIAGLVVTGFLISVCC